MDSMPERAGAAPTFSLLTNPFALLDAPQDASLADLAACADRAGTPEAAAAARALSVPRSRLAAEVAFLPGVAAPAVAALLAALRDARRPDGIAALPPTAEANLHAHLCAASQTASATALVRLAPEPSEALAAVLDARRAAAGLPRVPPAALAQERDALADRHAAALVDAVLAAGDPAATLSALIVDAPHDAAALLRKAAAAWTRRSATSLARLQDAAGAAVVVAGRDPATAAAAVAAIRAWAAYSRPQRLMDARAASDHRPTLAAIRPWRSAAARLATTSLAGGVALAEALASCCADLPGEGPVLRDEVQALHAHAEEQTLAPLLAELRLCAERLAAAPQPLCAVLARRRFAADLRRGEAAELWTRFDAACAASTLSEAPWVTVRTLVLALVGKDAGMPAARTALSLQRGMAARAAAAGRTDLAARGRGRHPRAGGRRGARRLSPRQPPALGAVVGGALAKLAHLARDPPGAEPGGRSRRPRRVAAPR